MFKNLSTETLGISGRDSEVIELALSHGFKGFDLHILDFAEQARTQGLAKARRLIDSARLRIGRVELPIDWTGDEAAFAENMKQTLELVELAKGLGADSITAYVEAGSENVPFHQLFEQHRRRSLEIAERLEPLGMALALAFHAQPSARAGRRVPFIQGIDTMLLLLSNISAANVGLAFDAWDWHVGGGSVEQLRSIGKPILSVRLADIAAEASVGQAEPDTRRLPGTTGVIDAAAILTTLAELGYAGPVSPAPDASNFTGQGRPAIVKQAAAALDQVWQAAGLNPAGKMAKTTVK